MQDIDIYNNSEVIITRKETRVFNIFIFMIIISILLFILFSVIYKYNDSTKLKGIVKDDMLFLTVDESTLELINHNDITIDGTKYKVIINSISEPIFDTNYNRYYELYLKIVNKGVNFVENNIININIYYDKKSLYERLKERIKEGMR